MYLTQDGTEVTLAQIQQAFYEGRAVLAHGNAEGRTATSLRLDGLDADTRGACESVWDEVWTTAPKSIQQCCAYASGVAAKAVANS